MVADHFEVVTYRDGSDPLHVTIEGPTKYFTIKMLDKPEHSRFTRPPRSDKENGPPVWHGPQIIVHLREGVTIDACSEDALFWPAMPGLPSNY